MISNNIKAVLEILKDEVNGDTARALEKMCSDYTMTWMYQGKNNLFPSKKVSKKKDLNEVYSITGRQYEIINIAEGKNIVFVELIESYPDPESRQIYKTPLILVLEMKGGMIRTGRHYCDPRVSSLGLTEQKIHNAYKSGIKSKVISQKRK
jgi:hypothetical protein